MRVSPERRRVVGGAGAAVLPGRESEAPTMVEVGQSLISLRIGDTTAEEDGVR